MNYNLITDDIAGRRYTPTCFISCHLPFCVSYAGNVAPSLLNINNQDIKSYFNFLTGVDQSRLENYGIDYLTTETYYIDIPDYGLCTGERYSNESGKNEPYTYECVIGNHSERRTRQVWKSITEIPELQLEKNKEICFDVWGRLRPKFGEKFAVDVIPHIKLQNQEFVMNEMAWWNASVAYERGFPTNATGTAFIPSTAIVVNGSYGVDFGGILFNYWVNAYTNGTNDTMFIEYNNATDVYFLNTSKNAEVCWENENGTSNKGNCPRDVWKNAVFVIHPKERVNCTSAGAGTCLLEDSSQNHLNVIKGNNNPITFDTPMAIGNSLNISQNCIVVNTTDAFTPCSSKCTLAFWIKQNKWEESHRLFEFGGAGDMWRTNSANGGIQLRVATSWSATPDATSYTHENGVAYCEVFTSDGTNTYHYINGQLNYTYSGFNWYTPSLTNIWFGVELEDYPPTACSVAVQSHWDEVRMYNVTWTAQQARDYCMQAKNTVNKLGSEETGTAPYITNITISPTTAYSDSILNCSAIYNDKEASKGSVSIEWLNGAVSWNKTTILNVNNGSMVSYELNSSIQSKGETWNCTVNATDFGGLAGTPNSTTITIQNSAPTIPSLLYPLNNSGSSAIPEFNWTNSQDADNDPINYTLQIDADKDFLSPEYSRENISQNLSGITGITPTNLSMDNYYWHVRAYDGQSYGSWSENRTFVYALWTITFNLTDSGTNQQISTAGYKNFDISCNNGFNVNDVENAYTAVNSFMYGIWSCNITGLDKYYGRNYNLTADADKTVEIPMSKELYLTAEEHDWLQAIYDCLYTGNCKALDLLEKINETTTKTWQRVTRTDMSVVTQEEFISATLSSNSNITLNYTIQIPFKEGYADGEYLPLRMYFWITNVDKTECYDQDKRTGSQNRAENPICFPLIAETLGPNNGSITFLVDLRPNLTDGTYNITRSVEIDPIFEGIRRWVNYGQEDVGQIVVEQGNSEITVSLIKTAETKPASISFLTGFASKEMFSLLTSSQTVQLAAMLTAIIITLLICITIYKLKRR